MNTAGPALALVELCSIARGVRTCDAMVKKAHIRLIHGGSTHPGKYGILIEGGVDEVGEALREGRTIAANDLIDWMYLPNPHTELLAALDGDLTPPPASLAVIETYSMAATIRAADAALKGAQVRAIRIRLARDLGGKGFFVLSGLLHDVEEAVKAGREAAGEGLVAGCEIVANPHPDVYEALT